MEKPPSNVLCGDRMDCRDIMKGGYEELECSFNNGRRDLSTQNNL